ncbi:MAG: ATP-binding protein [Pseudooceanicola sp.]
MSYRSGIVFNSIRIAKDRLGRSAEVSTRWLAVLTLALVTAIVATSTWVVLQARGTFLNEAHVQAANFTELLSQQSRAALQSTDVALQSMVERLQREGLEQDDPDFRRFIRTLNDRLELVRALFVIGPDGYIVHDTDYPDTPRVSLSDRRYFEALRTADNSDLFLGRPVQSRSVGTWFIPVARRIETSGGEFAGIAVAAVETTFVERVYGRLQLRPHDVVALFHEDGTLVASVPQLPELYGAKPEDIELFDTQLARTSEGVYQATNPISDRPAIVGYERVEGLPLVVAVGIDRRAALDGWRRYLWTVVLANFVMLALVLLLVSLIRRRQMERQLAQQKALIHEKIETIGYMTSGVAHDLKNILTVIDAGLRMVRRKGADERLLTSIEEAKHRGLALTDELLRFAKDKDVRKKAIAPDKQVAALKGLLERSVGHKVKLELALDASSARIEVIPAFLDSALMNLAVNASHAMPEGGRLTISTRIVTLTSHSSLPDGNYASISVEDTGDGMTDETLARLFEPFESTKGSQGTGLGLHQTRRFVLECEGDIDVTSEVDNGTRIEMLFPLSENEVHKRA